MANFVPILTTSDKLVQQVDPEAAYAAYEPGQIIFTQDERQIYIDDDNLNRIPYLLVTKTVVNNVTKGIVIGDGENNLASDGTALVLGGSNNTASGEYSIAAGYSTTAGGDFSFAFGQGVSAANDNEVVIGKYNATPNTNCLFIIGNGTSQTASNAVEVETTGNVNIRGNLTITGSLSVNINLDWISERSYTIGDIVIYNLKLYRCKTANSDTTFTDSNWDEITPIPTT